VTAFGYRMRSTSRIDDVEDDVDVVDHQIQHHADVIGTG